MRNVYLLSLLTFITAFVFNSNAEDCSELFISEYIEGSGNNKGVEIYNPTKETIELKNYLVARYSNGGIDYTSGGITRLEGTIAPGSTHVLINGQKTGTDTSPACSPELQALANQLDGAYPAPTYMNGNDAIALFKDATGSSTNPADYVVVDLFGIVGGGMQKSDLGWTDFTDAYAYKNIYTDGVITDKDSVYITNYIVPSGYYWLPWSKDHTLKRKASVKGGVTLATMPFDKFNVALEWDTVPGGKDIWTGLGSHDCECHPTAIEKINDNAALKIFKGEGAQSINILSEDLVFSVELYSLSGQLLYNESLGDGVFSYVFNLNRESKGIHLIKLSTSKGEISRKIIIQ